MNSIKHRPLNGKKSDEDWLREFNELFGVNPDDERARSIVDFKLNLLYQKIPSQLKKNVPQDKVLEEIKNTKEWLNHALKLAEHFLSISTVSES